MHDCNVRRQCRNRTAQYGTKWIQYTSLSKYFSSFWRSYRIWLKYHVPESSVKAYWNLTPLWKVKEKMKNRSESTQSTRWYKYIWHSAQTKKKFYFIIQINRYIITWLFPITTTCTINAIRQGANTTVTPFTSTK